MTLRRRLQALERQADAAKRDVWSAPGDASGRAQALANYHAGLGPRPPAPPCPPWQDPVAWAAQVRLNDCIDDRIFGKLADGQYHAGMTEADRNFVDNTITTLVNAIRDMPLNDLGRPAFEGEQECVSGIE